MPQGGGNGLRGPNSVLAGGTIKIDVGTNDATVEVSISGGGATTSYIVPPGKELTIQVPNLPQGTFIFISIGKGSDTKFIAVEVVSTPP